MHEHTPDAAPATVPAATGDGPQACAGCHRPLQPDTADAALVCWPCQDRTDQLLAALSDLYRRLTTATALLPSVRGTRGDTPPSSGPIHAPLPLRLETLNLSAAGGIPTRLQAIEDAWRITRSWPLPAAPARTAAPARFLRMNLTWACNTYSEIAQDLQEIRRIHTEATAALNPGPRPARIHTGTCPNPGPDGAPCGADLTATTADQRITCRTCGTRWTGLAAWRELRQAQEAHTTTRRRQPAGAAA